MNQELLLRVSAGLIFVAALSISGWHRHRARIEGGTIPRHRESPFLIALRILMALPILGTLLAFVVHPPWMAWSQLAVAGWLRWVGVGLGLLCVPLVYWVVKSLGRNISETVLTKEQHELVVHGPYRWVRHPLYITGVLLLASLALVTASWLLAALTAAAAVLIAGVVIPREEAALIATFGSRYLDYRRRTGGLIPGRFRPEGGNS